MPEKYYLDTSVWRDYYEERKDSSKDLGEFAFLLLSRLLASNSRIVVSTFLLRELERDYTLEKIRGIMRPFESLLERATVSKKQIDEAEKIALQRNLPKGDAIHAILARDCKALLVSRDKHFNYLKDICPVAKPEELI